jgi:hypothetical protein
VSRLRTFPELEGKTADELRFYRLIEDRATNDGEQTIELACGHSRTLKTPLPDEQMYAACPTCVEAWLDRFAPRCAHCGEHVADPDAHTCKP